MCLCGCNANNTFLVFADKKQLKLLVKTARKMENMYFDRLNLTAFKSSRFKATEHSFLLKRRTRIKKWIPFMCEDSDF
jgi:hypothetical protein